MADDGMDTTENVGMEKRGKKRMTVMEQDFAFRGTPSQAPPKWVRDVLKDRHSTLQLSPKASRQVYGMIQTLAPRVARKAADLSALTIQPAHVARAVSVLLPEELAMHAVAFGKEACARYLESKAGTKEKPVSKNTRADIKASIGYAERVLRAESKQGGRTSDASPVFLAAVLQYITSEIFSLCGDKCKELKKSTIYERHVYLAIASDADLNRLVHTDLRFKILGGGVTPYIYEELLPEMKRVKKAEKRKRMQLKMENVKKEEEEEEEEEAPTKKKKKVPAKKKVVPKKAPAKKAAPKKAPAKKAAAKKASAKKAAAKKAPAKKKGKKVGEKFVLAA
jgi:hypothetical protein